MSVGTSIEVLRSRVVGRTRGHSRGLPHRMQSPLEPRLGGSGTAQKGHDAASPPADPEHGKAEARRLSRAHAGVRPPFFCPWPAREPPSTARRHPRRRRPHLCSLRSPSRTIRDARGGRPVPSRDRGFRRRRHGRCRRSRLARRRCDIPRQPQDAAAPAPFDVGRSGVLHVDGHAAVRRKAPVRAHARRAGFVGASSHLSIHPNGLVAAPGDPPDPCDEHTQDLVPAHRWLSPRPGQGRRSRRARRLERSPPREERRLPRGASLADRRGAHGADPTAAGPDE